MKVFTIRDVVRLKNMMVITGTVFINDSFIGSMRSNLPIKRRIKLLQYKSARRRYV